MTDETPILSNEDLIMILATAVGWEPPLGVEGINLYGRIDYHQGAVNFWVEYAPEGRPKPKVAGWTFRESIPRDELYQGLDDLVEQVRLREPPIDTAAMGAG